MQIRIVPILIYSLVATQGLEAQAASSVRVADLRCEYLRNPLGLDVAQPRLSWRLLAANARDRGQRQTAYQVLVAGSRRSLDSAKGDLWDTGQLASDQSTHVAYAGRPLVRTDYERASHFECNVPLLNRIYDTTFWTFENLSLGGYVVDCPQRERMGYGGDGHATTPTGLNNYALGVFYSEWSEDWRDVQGSSSAWGTVVCSFTT